jgi:hypothetical protein
MIVRTLALLTIILCLSGCYSAYRDTSTPCGNPRYTELSARSSLTAVEKVEFDSLDSLCQSHLDKHGLPLVIVLVVVGGIALAYLVFVAFIFQGTDFH